MDAILVLKLLVWAALGRPRRRQSHESGDPGATGASARMRCASWRRVLSAAPRPPLSARAPPRGAGRRPHGERPHGPLARRVERAADRLLLPPLRVGAGRHPPGHGAARAPQQRPQRRGGLHLRQVSPPLPVCACACVCTYTCVCVRVRLCVRVPVRCWAVAWTAPAAAGQMTALTWGARGGSRSAGSRWSRPSGRAEAAATPAGFPGMRLAR